MCATHSISVNCDNVGLVTNNGQGNTCCIALTGMFSHTGTKLYTSDKMRS